MELADEMKKILIENNQLKVKKVIDLYKVKLITLLKKRKKDPEDDSVYNDIEQLVKSIAKKVGRKEGPGMNPIDLIDLSGELSIVQTINDFKDTLINELED